MKRLLASIALGAVLLGPVRAFAVPGDEYDDSQSHPLRVAAYIIHPVGVGLEYLIFRPIHMLVSANPTTEKIFGHTPHGAGETAEYQKPAYGANRSISR